MAEGFLDFTDGNILTGVQVDDYLMRQSVMRFASSAARDTALASVLTEGLFAFLEDTDTLTVYSGSEWMTAGSFGAWTTWTPTAIGSTTFTYAKYRRTWGRGIDFRVKVTWDAVTTANPIQVTPPFSVHADYTEYTPVGTAMIVNAGTSRFEGICVVNSTSSFSMVRIGDYVTNSNVFTFGSGDLFMLSGTYEPSVVV